MRYNRSNDITLIPNALLNDKNISLTARGLLCYLLIDDSCIMTEQNLSEATGEGLASVKSALKELIDAKYIHIVSDNGEVTYYIYEEPMDNDSTSVTF